MPLAFIATMVQSARVDPRTVPWTELVRTGRTHGWTELLWAVENLEVNEVRRLLEAGEDPNADVFDGGTTILHWALDAEGVVRSYDDDSCGCEIAKLLIAHGADVRAVDGRGRSPLDCSLMYLDTGAEAVLREALQEFGPKV
ncbi:MAG: ankyrin repeat domain-containing protein [Thermoleophilia bacterium]